MGGNSGQPIRRPRHFSVRPGWAHSSSARTGCRAFPRPRSRSTMSAIARRSSSDTLQLRHAWQRRRDRGPQLDKTARAMVSAGASTTTTRSNSSAARASASKRDVVDDDRPRIPGARGVEGVTDTGRRTSGMHDRIEVSAGCGIREDEDRAEVPPVQACPSAVRISSPNVAATAARPARRARQRPGLRHQHRSQGPSRESTRDRALARRDSSGWAPRYHALDPIGGARIQLHTMGFIPEF